MKSAEKRINVQSYGDMALSGIWQVMTLPCKVLRYFWKRKCCGLLAILFVVEAIRITAAYWPNIRSIFQGEPSQPSVPTIVAIANTEKENRRGDVVFIHGLMGDGQSTWTSANDFYWPKELGADLQDVGVWVINYEAVPSDWQGSTLPIEGQSIRLLEALKNHKIGERRIIFVTHSLGGIIAKQMIQDASDLGLHDYEDIKLRTRGVVLLGVPNTGSNLASYQVFLEKAGLPFASTITQHQLENNAPILMRLNTWYRQNAVIKEIKTKAFYETEPYSGSIVVNQASADPNVFGVAAIPVQGANHKTICKPKSREDDVYSSVYEFIDKHAIPYPSKWDITFYQFLDRFGQVWNNAQELELFKKEGVDKEVVWEGIVRTARPDRKPPSCAICLDLKAATYLGVECQFEKWNFDAAKIKVGEKITVQGILSEKTSGVGAILRDCRLKQ